MDFDEYDYLEKNIENLNPQGKIGADKDVSPTNSDEEKVRKRSSRHSTDVKADDIDHRSKRSRTRDESRDHGTERDSSRRHHISQKDDRRSSDRDRNRSSRERGDKTNRHKDREERNGRDRDRERDRPRDSMRERDRDKLKRSDNEGDHDREKDREPERSHRSRSQSERGREKSREREHERENENEYKERDRNTRPRKDKKDGVEIEVDPERDQRTVFAYQITQKAGERDIFEFFSRAGKVRDVRLIMDRISRRSRGVGYVEFVDAMSVPMAIALCGQPLLGQPVMVKPSEAEKNLVQPTPSGGAINGAIGPYSGGARRLYVGNLHLGMKEDQLRQVFEAFGTVELVQLSTEPQTGHCKGFGFVQFARLEDARAAECLNGQLEIAGHVIKVSAVTEQILLETGVNTGDFDDSEGGGLALNGSSRALLMQKLDRTGTWSSVTGMTPHPLVQQVALSVPPVTVPSFDLIGVPSECLLLKNMFDPKIETETDFELDIKEDINEECSKFGTLRHIFVDKNSAGFVYLRFGNTEAAMSAQRALHGRWFAGKMITATFMVLQDYEAKFPESR